MNYSRMKLCYYKTVFEINSYYKLRKNFSIVPFMITLEKILNNHNAIVLSSWPHLGVKIK